MPRKRTRHKKDSMLALAHAMAKPNTLKTTLRFLPTLLRRFVPARWRRKHLASIYNYLPVDERIATSGQPTEAQFEEIFKAGYGTVINLAPHNAENALPDEAGLLAANGIEYIHIPVDFRKPSDADFGRFCAAMASHGEQKLWVHCAANMRVSAFMYRYRCEVLGEDPGLAVRDLKKIWTPFGAWKAFIARTGDQPPGHPG